MTMQYKYKPTEAWNPFFDDEFNFVNLKFEQLINGK